MNWADNKTIVVPIDFSDESVRALDEALNMVASPSQVHVVHVMQDGGFGVSEMSYGPSEREMHVQQLTQALRGRLWADKYNDVQVCACFGDPGIEISRFAQHVKADLIVMPSHGRGGLKGLPIGSVAERVVRLAHCPTLILKAAQICVPDKMTATAVSSNAGAIS